MPQLKQLFLFLISSILLVSCKFDKAPEFVRVSSINIRNYTPEKITLTSNLVFKNPNHMGGVLQADTIKVIGNNIEMGTVNSPDFIVPSLHEFSVPIEFVFAYKDLFKDPENVLGNILNAATSQKLNVRYVGNLTYKLNVFTYDYPLDYSQEIELKRKKY